MDILTKIILFFNTQLEGSSPKIKEIKYNIFLTGLVIAVGSAMIFLIKQVNPSTDNVLLLIILVVATIMSVYLVKLLHLKGKAISLISFAGLIVLLITFLMLYDESYGKRVKNIFWTKEEARELNLYFYSDSLKESFISGGRVDIAIENFHNTYYLTERHLSIMVLPIYKGKIMSVFPDIPGFETKKISVEIPEKENNIDIIIKPKVFSTKIYGTIISNRVDSLREVREIEWGGIKLDINHFGEYSADLPYRAGDRLKLVIKMKDGRTIVRNSEVIPRIMPHEIVL